MPQSSEKCFFGVLKEEVQIINRRRELVAAGRLIADRGYTCPEQPSGWAHVAVQPSGTDERGQRIPRLVSQQDIVGLACSGGGVRSAAFCLGVFQGLDSINTNEKPQVLDAVDYLSTVSGGGYIGTSVTAGLTYGHGKFPFETKLDQQETLETKHIRDYSNYLAPEGFKDIIVGLVAIMRGLLINAMIFLGIILAVAAVTVRCNPDKEALLHPYLDFTHGAFPSVFLWTTVFIVLFFIIQTGYAIIALRPRKRQRTKLAEREGAGRVFAFFLIFCTLASFFELQRYMLAALFNAGPANQLGGAFLWLHTQFQTPWTFLVAVATALTAFGNKLVAIATATRGDRSWPGFLKHWASRVALYAAALAVPLLLWSVYLAFCYWGIDGEEVAKPMCVPPHAPDWLTWLRYYSGLGPIGIYAIAAVFLIWWSLWITPNANSLHGYYRDRLSRAFLWLNLESQDQEETTEDPKKINLARYWAKVGNAVRAALVTDVNVDQIKLSSLKKKDGEKWSDDVRFAPYLLMNTAVNLEGSDYLNQRGRNADSFFFSPRYVGSEATGYGRTETLEKADTNADLGTAMAISGAAASANMGASTIKALRFSLAALNVRLGYWLPNPRYLENWHRAVRWAANIGPLYFALETFGLLNEKTQNVYLTDGGHFDNLGLYELLRRRCKVIIVADAEADPPLNFASLIRLQRYARIDLGVLIDLPWEDIRRSSDKITKETPHGPLDDPEQCCGPHVAIGRIDYGEDERGALIYIKASVSGDESDLIRDYRRRNPAFPHETTLDQFFSEEQFEVYRALGFHATRNFFIGRDCAAMLRTSPVKDWPEFIQRALNRLNTPANAVGRIVDHQRDALGELA